MNLISTARMPPAAILLLLLLLLLDLCLASTQLGRGELLALAAARHRRRHHRQQHEQSLHDGGALESFQRAEQIDKGEGDGDKDERGSSRSASSSNKGKDDSAPGRPTSKGKVQTGLFRHNDQGSLNQASMGALGLAQPGDRDRILADMTRKVSILWHKAQTTGNSVNSEFDQDSAGAVGPGSVAADSLGSPLSPRPGDLDNRLLPITPLGSGPYGQSLAMANTASLVSKIKSKAANRTDWSPAKKELQRQLDLQAVPGKQVVERLENDTEAESQLDLDDLKKFAIAETHRVGDLAKFQANRAFFRRGIPGANNVIGAGYDILTDRITQPILLGTDVSEEYAADSDSDIIRKFRVPKALKVQGGMNKDDGNDASTTFETVKSMLDARAKRIGLDDSGGAFTFAPWTREMMEVESRYNVLYEKTDKYRTLEVAMRDSVGWDPRFQYNVMKRLVDLGKEPSSNFKIRLYDETVVASSQREHWAWEGNPHIEQRPWTVLAPGFTADVANLPICAFCYQHMEHDADRQRLRIPNEGFFRSLRIAAVTNSSKAHKKYKKENFACANPSNYPPDFKIPEPCNYRHMTKLHQFVQKYGTHYIREGKFGGETTRQVEVNRETVEDMGSSTDLSEAVRSLADEYDDQKKKNLAARAKMGKLPKLPYASSAAMKKGWIASGGTPFGIIYENFEVSGGTMTPHGEWVASRPRDVGGKAKQEWLDSIVDDPALIGFKVNSLHKLLKHPDAIRQEASGYNPSVIGSLNEPRNLGMGEKEPDWIPPEYRDYFKKTGGRVRKHRGNFSTSEGKTMPTGDPSVMAFKALSASKDNTGDESEEADEGDKDAERQAQRSRKQGQKGTNYDGNGEEEPPKDKPVNPGADNDVPEEEADKQSDSDNIDKYDPPPPGDPLWRNFMTRGVGTASGMKIPSAKAKFEMVGNYITWLMFKSEMLQKVIHAKFEVDRTASEKLVVIAKHRGGFMGMVTQVIGKQLAASTRQGTGFEDFWTRLVKDLNSDVKETRMRQVIKWVLLYARGCVNFLHACQKSCKLERDVDIRLVALGRYPESAVPVYARTSNRTIKARENFTLVDPQNRAHVMLMQRGKQCLEECDATLNSYTGTDGAQSAYQIHTLDDMTARDAMTEVMEDVCNTCKKVVTHELSPKKKSQPDSGRNLKGNAEPADAKSSPEAGDDQQAGGSGIDDANEAAKAALDRSSRGILEFCEKEERNPFYVKFCQSTHDHVRSALIDRLTEGKSSDPMSGKELRNIIHEIFKKDKYFKRFGIDGKGIDPMSKKQFTPSQLATEVCKRVVVCQKEPFTHIPVGPRQINPDSFVVAEDTVTREIDSPGFREKMGFLDDGNGATTSDDSSAASDSAVKEESSKGDAGDKKSRKKKDSGDEDDDKDADAEADEKAAAKRKKSKSCAEYDSWGAEIVLQRARQDIASYKKKCYACYIRQYQMAEAARRLQSMRSDGAFAALEEAELQKPTKPGDMKSEYRRIVKAKLEIFLNDTRACPIGLYPKDPLGYKFKPFPRLKRPEMKKTSQQEDDDKFEADDADDGNEESFLEMDLYDGSPEPANATHSVSYHELGNLDLSVCTEEKKKYLMALREPIVTQKECRILLKDINRKLIAKTDLLVGAIGLKIPRQDPIISRFLHFYDLRYSVFNFEGDNVGDANGVSPDLFAKYGKPGQSMCNDLGYCRKEDERAMGQYWDNYAEINWNLEDGYSNTKVTERFPVMIENLDEMDYANVLKKGGLNANPPGWSRKESMVPPLPKPKPKKKTGKDGTKSPRGPGQGMAGGAQKGEGSGGGEEDGSDSSGGDAGGEGGGGGDDGPSFKATSAILRGGAASRADWEAAHREVTDRSSSGGSSSGSSSTSGRSVGTGKSSSTSSSSSSSSSNSSSAAAMTWALPDQAAAETYTD